MKKFKILFSVAIFFTSTSVFAKLNVMTTTADLGALVREIGGDEVQLDIMCKGAQDPHHIEAEPSDMVKANHADLVVSVGLGLEIGWLPNILRGARNAKIADGTPGNLVTGTLIDPIEVPPSTVTRAEGDVHPEGNPHFTLDPIRTAKVAIKIGERLAQLDVAHADEFKKRAKALSDRLESKVSGWKARIQSTQVKKVITYHKTLSYFLDRFGIQSAAILELKPGVPPTGPHIVEVISIAKEQKVPLILIENFFSDQVAERIKTEIPSIRVVTVPVSVDGAPGINQIDDVYETLVRAIEGKSK